MDADINQAEYSTPEKTAANSRSHLSPGSSLGFRWSIAIDDQAPFACYADKVAAPNAIRYRTLDGKLTGWREPNHLRPLATANDWRELQAAIKSHELDMARKLIAENAK